MCSLRVGKAQQSRGLALAGDLLL